MDFRITPDQATFITDMQTYLDEQPSADAMDEIMQAGGADMDAGPAGLKLLEKLGHDGWLGVSWPAGYGGRGRSELEQWAFLEELAYRRLPNGGLTISSCGPTIARVGTDQQKEEFLPGILSGELVFGVGYTEPESGSDLASLQTRAVQEGDEYVINGQKVFTTLAHHATHFFLAVRTGPKDSKHRGITILLVPADTPGVTVRPLHTQAGIRTNEVFLENVRVPVSSRLGEENHGWAIIVMALDFERLFAHSGLVHDYEDLVEWATRAPAWTGEGTVVADPASRQRLAELAVGLDTTRLFLQRTAWMIDEGLVPNTEASMSKVTFSENIQHIASGALQLMDEAGQLHHGEGSAPADGYLERRYRTSSMLKFGGGTNEVQRNIIAQRGLGLPR